MDAGVRSQALLPCGLHVVAGVGTLGSAGKFGSAVQRSASCSRNTADPSSSMPCVGKCAGGATGEHGLSAHSTHNTHIRAQLLASGIACSLRLSSILTSILVQSAVPMTSSLIRIQSCGSRQGCSQHRLPWEVVASESARRSTDHNVPRPARRCLQLRWHALPSLYMLI